MIKVCVWSVCLFSALSVGMKTLSQTGLVGGHVTFACSGWEGFLLTDLETYIKYLGISSCTDKNAIMTVKPGQTEQKDRISLTNTGPALSVTFTNLQKSDSNTYYCGLERYLIDSCIKLNLTVTDVVTPGPTTTIRTVSVRSSSAVSSTSSDITTHPPTSFTRQSTASAASEARGGGRVVYLTIGFTFIITTLLLLLCLMMKMKKAKNKKVSKSGSPETVTQQETDYAEIGPEDHTESSPAADVHMETLYANYSSQRPSSSAQDSVTDSQCDCIYSVAQLPTEQPAQKDPESSTVYTTLSVVQPAQAK